MTHPPFLSFLETFEAIPPSKRTKVTDITAISGSAILQRLLSSPEAPPPKHYLTLWTKQKPPIIFCFPTFIQKLSLKPISSFLYKTYYLLLQKTTHICITKPYLVIQIPTHFSYPQKNKKEKLFPSTSHFNKANQIKSYISMSTPVVT